VLDEGHPGQAHLRIEGIPFPGYQWTQCLSTLTWEKDCPWKTLLPLACLTLSRT
jgi:hypothetical protein